MKMSQKKKKLKVNMERRKKQKKTKTVDEHVKKGLVSYMIKKRQIRHQWDSDFSPGCEIIRKRCLKLLRTSENGTFR